MIDNADLLLDDEDRRFINFDSSNQYMIFARNCDGLNLSAGSFMLLYEDDYKISLKSKNKIKHLFSELLKLQWWNSVLKTGLRRILRRFNQVELRIWYNW